MEPNRISVVLTVFNGEKYLSETLSCLKKNRRDIDQIIVVEDAGTDGSKKILESYSELFDVLIFHEKNRGSAQSRMDGIACSNCEWVHILDQDDLIAEGFFSHARNLFSESDIVFSEVRIMNMEANCIYRGADIFKHALDVENLLFHGSPLSTPSQVLFRRKFFQGISLKSQFLGSEDFDLWLRILAKKPRQSLLQGFPVFWRWHQTNASTRFLVNPEFQLGVIRGFIRDFPEYASLRKRAEAVVMTYAAVLRKKIGRPWLKLFLHAVERSPTVLFSRTTLNLLTPKWVRWLAMKFIFRKR
ncbi:MAG: glycosyltransferase family A protein [Candidatus Ozemobacteraceae bacterium]